MTWLRRNETHENLCQSIQAERVRATMLHSETQNVNVNVKIETHQSM